MSSKRSRDDDHAFPAARAPIDHSAFFTPAAAAAAASSEPASKKPNTSDLHYQYLVRHASSVANWKQKFAKVGLLPESEKQKTQTDFSLQSKRIAAVYRCVRQLSTKLNLESVKDLFRFVRCAVRFKDSVMQVDEEKDKEAMNADSDEDKVMIRLVEECVKKVGYFMLRALVDIRTIGSATAKGMGLYAIICCNDTLQDYISLVFSHYSMTQLFMHKAFASVPVFNHQLNDQAAHLRRFAKLGYLAPPDLLEADLMVYQPEYDAAVYEDELKKENEIMVYGEWPDWIRFARMVKQATLHKPKKSALVILPIITDENGKENEKDKAIRKEKQNEYFAMHKNLGLRALQVDLEKNTDFDLGGAFGAGTALYSTATQIFQNFATALGITGIPATFKVLQCGFIRRIITIECVMLQFCFDKLAGRTDAREILMKYCRNTLRDSLDRVVVSAAKHARSEN